MNKITIIGGGNLGTAIARGILDAGHVPPSSLTITKRNISTLSHFSHLGVNVTTDNAAATRDADLVILAVKPYQVQEVLSGCTFHKTQVIVSVVTGVSLEQLQTLTGKAPILFRAMPNTAIAVRQSMTCISYARAEEREIDTVQAIFASVGTVVFIDEKLMNAATVLGACGIAFAMRYMRATIQGGIQIGFDAQKASLIAEQTVKGAVELLLADPATHPEVEIDKVTTPKGCTIAGLNEMEHQGFSSALIKGLVTSFQEISKF